MPKKELGAPGSQSLTAKGCVNLYHCFKTACIQSILLFLFAFHLCIRRFFFVLYSVSFPLLTPWRNKASDNAIAYNYYSSLEIGTVVNLNIFLAIATVVEKNFQTMITDSEQIYTHKQQCTIVYRHGFSKMVRNAFTPWEKVRKRVPRGPRPTTPWLVS